MDVGSKAGYPANALSNFSPHPFTFDGVECNSMEGFLQSLKFDKPHVQEEVCKLVGFAAKKRGKPRNKTWQQKQTLWWKGVAFDRHSFEYKELLYNAYKAMTFQSESFKKALLASKDAVYTHSIGHNDASKTILTEKEFCALLTTMRRMIISLEIQRKLK